MQRGHDEALPEVVKVLGEHKLIVLIVTAACVEQASLEAGAECTETVPLKLARRHFDDRLADVMIRHSEASHIRDEWRRIEGRCLWIYGAAS